MKRNKFRYWLCIISGYWIYLAIISVGLHFVQSNWTYHDLIIVLIISTPFLLIANHALLDNTIEPNKGTLGKWLYHKKDK